MSDDYRVSLAQLVGKPIGIFCSFFSNKPELVQVILRGIEAVGIWVENLKLNQETLEHLKLSASEYTPVIFVPYHKVEVIVVTVESLTLSESSFHGEE